MIVKEFVQMRRDRMTFATMLFVPILQLTLFGYAINTDPKNMPAVMLDPRLGPLDPRRARSALRTRTISTSSSRCAIQRRWTG